jgi:GTP-dependent phosphoenolpyruvate carboxykinase
LLTVNPEQWQVAMEQFGEYLAGYGDRLPEGLRAEHETILQALA